MTQHALWCIRIAGPDEVFAAESHDAAIEVAREHNDHMKILAPEDREMVRAYVELWPWSAESHADDLRRNAQ